MSLTSPYPGQPPAAAVQRQLAAVYRSPRLDTLRHPVKGGGSPLSQLGQLLLNWLESEYRAAGPLFWVVLGLAVLLVLGGLALVLLRRQRGALPPRAVAGPGGPGPASEPPTAEELFGRAERLEHAGSLREAIRVAFQGLLLASSPGAALGFESSWTNSELLLAASRRSGLEGQLRPLVARFDAVVYGGREPTPAACRDFTASCRRTAGGLNR